MKQVLQARTGLTVVRDVPVPPCPPGSLLVRNEYSVISSGTERSRVELSQKSLLAKARERPDLVRTVIDRAAREGIRSTRQAVNRQLSAETAVGYSSAGRVIEVGSAVAGFDVGDAVACAGGGHANHAEVVSVPANLCAPVPDGVPLQSAAFATIAAIALHGIRLADVRVGDRVAVIGCGLVGQIAIRLLRAAGAETFAIDLDASRVDAARRGGADHGFDAAAGAAAGVLAATGSLGVDQVLITAAAKTNDPLLLGAEIARDRATVIVVGAVPIDVPRAPLYDKELVVRVSRSYGPGRYDTDYEERGLDYPIGYVRWTEKRNMEAVLVLIGRARLSLDDLIDEVVPVEDAARAYERLVGDAGPAPRGAIVLSYREGPAASSEGAPTPTPAPADNGGSRTATATSAAEGASPQGGAPLTAYGAAAGGGRLALIGPGSFASRVIVPAFAAAGAQLEVVGGGSGPSADAAVRNLGFRRSAESAEAAIADASVDIVAICTRHGSHAELSERALRAGKHVFCEKPLALTHEELEAVLDAAETAVGIFIVGFNRRFSPLLGELRGFLSRDGSPLLATYRVSAGHLEASHWTHDLEQGGGRALGEACHFIDSLVYLAGSPIERVHAAGYGAAGAPIQSRDNLAITLTFGDGSVGSVIYVAEGSGKVGKERLEVFSGARTGILDDYQRLELLDGRRSEVRKSRGQDKGHRAEVQAFLEGTRTGTPPIPLVEIANVSLATLAVIESLRTGMPVELEKSELAAEASPPAR